MGAAVAGKPKRTKRAASALNPHAIYKLLGGRYSIRAVQDWAQDGMPLTSERDALLWIIDRKQEQVDAKGESSLGKEKQRAEIKLIDAKTKTVELEYRRREGELVERQAVIRERLRDTNDARLRIETIPQLVRAYLPEDERREIIVGDVEGVCNSVIDSLARRD